MSEPESSDVPKEIAPPPAGAAEDPRAFAQYLVELLDTLATQATDDARRMRVALIDIISAYRDAPDKETARAQLTAQLAGLEVGVATLLAKNARKIRERLRSELKRIGASSAAGKTMRTAAEGMNTLVQGLETMVQAAQRGDAALRTEAQAILGKARDALQALDKR